MIVKGYKNAQALGNGDSCGFIASDGLDIKTRTQIKDLGYKYVEVCDESGVKQAEVFDNGELVLLNGALRKMYKGQWLFFFALPKTYL